MPKHEGDTRTDLRKYTYMPKRLAVGEEPDPEPTEREVQWRRSAAERRASTDPAERLATFVVDPRRHSSSPHRNESPALDRRLPAPPAPVMYRSQPPRRGLWRRFLRLLAGGR